MARVNKQEAVEFTELLLKLRDKDNLKAAGPLDALNFYMKNKEMIDGLMALLKPLFDSLFKKKTKPTEEVEETEPTKPVKPKPIDPEETEVKRVISGAHSNEFGIHRDGKLIPTDEAKRIYAGEDPMDDGDRIRFDNDPLDQFGDEIFQEASILNALGPKHEPHNVEYLLEVIEGDIEPHVTNIGDNWGLTPSVKVTRGDMRKGAFTFQIKFNLSTGEVLGNKLGPFRVKPWGN